MSYKMMLSTYTKATEEFHQIENQIKSITLKEKEDYYTYHTGLLSYIKILEDMVHTNEYIELSSEKDEKNLLNNPP